MHIHEKREIFFENYKTGIPIFQISIFFPNFYINIFIIAQLQLYFSMTLLCRILNKEYNSMISGRNFIREF